MLLSILVFDWKVIVSWQRLLVIILCRVLRRLILVYTICKFSFLDTRHLSPFYGSTWKESYLVFAKHSTILSGGTIEFKCQCHKCVVWVVRIKNTLSGKANLSKSSPCHLPPSATEIYTRNKNTKQHCSPSSRARVFPFKIDAWAQSLSLLCRFLFNRFWCARKKNGRKFTKSSFLVQPLQISNFFLIINIRRNVRKRTFGHMRPTKIQISLRIRTVWSESSLGAFWVVKDANFLHADNKDSDQTARMRRLIWVFVGRTCPYLFFIFPSLSASGGLCFVTVEFSGIFTYILTLSTNSCNMASVLFKNRLISSRSTLKVLCY